VSAVLRPVHPLQVLERVEEAGFVLDEVLSVAIASSGKPRHYSQPFFETP
jgi:hypothetical protein